MQVLAGDDFHAISHLLWFRFSFASVTRAFYKNTHQGCLTRMINASVVRALPSVNERNTMMFNEAVERLGSPSVKRVK